VVVVVDHRIVARSIAATLFRALIKEVVQKKCGVQ